MNILIISHMFPSISRPSYGTFVLHQTKALKALGHNVYVVSPQPFIPKWFTTSVSRWKAIQNMADEEEIEGIKVLFKKRLNIPRFFLRFHGRIYYYWLRSLISSIILTKKIDLVHCHTIFPDGDLGYMIKSEHNIPLVITIHGVDLYRISNHWVNRRRIRKILFNSDSVICVSKQFKKLLKRIDPEYKNLPPLEVIYNGIQIYDDYEKPNWCGFDDALKILTIATLIPRKNINLVLHAVHQLKNKFPDLVYFVIGEGWDEKELKNLSAKLGLDDRVFFLGAMPHPDAMAYLRECDVFVLPSVNESFGVVYIESMYFKRITIGSKGEGIEDVIIDDHNGFLVDNSSISDIYNKMDNILNNLKQFKHIKENAYHSVWPKFSWQNNALEHQNLYKKLIEKYE